jgi:hypothetical protein
LDLEFRVRNNLEHLGHSHGSSLVRSLDRRRSEIKLEEINHRERAKSVEILSGKYFIDTFPAWSGVRYGEMSVGYSSESNPMIPIASSHHGSGLFCDGIDGVKGEPFLPGWLDVLSEYSLEFHSR